MDRFFASVIHQIQQRWQEAPLNKGGAGAQTRPQCDPANQLPFHLTSLGIQSRIAVGTIVDLVPRNHCYKVLIENGRSFAIATTLTATTCSEVGVKTIGMLQLGTRVWLLLHPQTHYAVIIGAEPAYGAAVGGLLPGMVSQASRTFVDSAYVQPLMMANNQVIDWSAGRPLDSIPGYEQGFMSATGLKITIDDFLLQLAVNEHCGVFGFYHDSLLRVAGLNLQIWAATAEQEWLNDTGEAYEYYGSATYPWEQAGYLKPQLDQAQVRASQAFLVDEPEFSHWEPKSPNARAFHRAQRFGGFLGQGRHEFVTLPRIDDSDQFEYGPGLPLSGVHERFVCLDGRVGERSAKGLTFSKRLLIPVPRQLARPEDPAGDTTANYKFSGLFGEGEDKTITGDVATTDDQASLQRAAGVLDLHAYIFNYQGSHPFNFHSKDWSLPNESEMEFQSQPVPDFSSLATKQYLPAPPSVEMSVDHRYGKQKYYQNESALSLLDDGAIVLYDGFGTDVRMTSGSLFLAAPGDIWIKAGRNVNIWAGDSINLRARKNIEVSTSTEDVRIRAKRNVLALAEQGLLLESRGASQDYNFDTAGDPQFGGIVLRAVDGVLATWSGTTYVRTTSGPLTLDANKGQGIVVINSSSELHMVSQQVAFLYGEAGNITRTDQFSADSKILSGSLVVVGQAVIDGTLTTNGSIFVAGGHIATEQAKAASGLVAPLDGVALSQVHTDLANVENEANNALPKAGDAAYTLLLSNLFYDDPKAGSDTTLQKGQFTFRSDEQYGTTDFQLYEDRWQHLLTASRGSSTAWKESSVVSAVGTTYPYPGRQAFEGNTFRQQTDSLVDGTTGDAKDRSDPAYINPSLKASTAVSLQKYPVIH